MAQTVKVILVDDLSGEPADETVIFGLNGRDYQIDLSQENAQELRDLLKPYINKGRSLPTPKGTKKSSSPEKNPDTPRIREWAQEQGYKVSARGRIKEDILNSYYSSQEK